MTNEQAIKWLKETLKETDFQYEQMEIAVEMAIKALEKVEKYEKAIEDINVVIKLLKKRYPQDAGYLYHKALDDVLEVIDKYIWGAELHFVEELIVNITMTVLVQMTI